MPGIVRTIFLALHDLSLVGLDIFARVLFKVEHDD